MDEVARLPWVDEDAIADRHPIVYHYTRVKYLDPILTSRGIYATHFAHTNDAEEFYGLRAKRFIQASAKQLRARAHHPFRCPKFP